MQAPITDTTKLANPVVWKPISPNRKLPTKEPSIPTRIFITRPRCVSIILPAIYPTIAPAIMLKIILFLLFYYSLLTNFITNNPIRQC